MVVGVSVIWAGVNGQPRKLRTLSAWGPGAARVEELMDGAQATALESAFSGLAAPSVSHRSRTRTSASSAWRGRTKLQVALEVVSGHRVSWHILWR